MDPASPDDLRERVRTAYERGRWRAALLGGWPVLVLAIVCLGAGVPPQLVVPVAIVHAVVVVALLHRGRGATRSIPIGWLAGSLPLIVALLACRVPHACGGPSCVAWCLPGCLGASFVAGLVVVRRAMRRPHDARATAVIATLVAALTAGMGCTVLGIGGALAVLFGLALVTGPAVLVAARR